jgi:hypothetical protein
VSGPIQPTIHPFNSPLHSIDQLDLAIAGFDNQRKELAAKPQHPLYPTSNFAIGMKAPPAYRQPLFGRGGKFTKAFPDGAAGYTAPLCTEVSRSKVHDFLNMM